VFARLFRGKGKAMEAQKVFGRRIVTPHAPSGGREPARPAPPAGPLATAPAGEQVLPPWRSAAAAQFESELHEWKRARRRAYKLPWNQLSLMASLCFGVAALVLPGTVNENLDMLLYGLMAASFVAGLRRRRN
jgi:hypothetical protein